MFRLNNIKQYQFRTVRYTYYLFCSSLRLRCDICLFQLIVRADMKWAGVPVGGDVGCLLPNQLVNENNCYELKI